MTTLHTCEHEGCQSIETDEYFYPFDTEGLSEWLCYDHAVEDGFCVWCRYMGVGLESFDFNGLPGYHTDCYQQLQAETGDDDDYDEYDDYPHSWYDPDVDSSAEDSTHTYIGEDREDLG